MAVCCPPPLPFSLLPPPSSLLPPPPSPPLLPPPLLLSSFPPYTDMGVQLFLDIVRTVKPTHIIRLLPPFLRSVDHVRTLPPLTAEFLTTTPGLFTWPEQTSPQSPVKVIEPGFIQGEKSLATQSYPYKVMFLPCPYMVMLWSCPYMVTFQSCPYKILSLL